MIAAISDGGTMSGAMFEPAGRDVDFSVKPLGFDRREVRAFVANLLSDYERLRAELDRVRGTAPVAPEIEGARPIGTTSRDVQRILEGAQRVADDLERRAAEESAQIVEDARGQAAEVLAGAQKKAVEITAEARRNLGVLEARAATLQAYFMKLRDAFETAADTAGSALSDIAEARLDEVPVDNGATAKVGA
jgi:cell division septum initiation protein DivIVA